jgi:sialidase-1
MIVTRRISVLSDGRVILSYFRLLTVPMAGDGIYIVELDKQLKAGKPKKLQHDAGTSAQLRDFGNGLLMMGSYHIDQPYVLRSPDNGRTWQVFAIDNGGKVLDAETDLIRLRDGWFYAVMRGSGCNGHYSVSVDGKNWTTAADIGFPLHCPELFRSGSFVLLAQRVPATALYWSADECKTWRGPVAVDSVGGAYPSMVGLKDSRVLIVYYEEGKESNIRCRKFSIAKDGVSWKK